MEHDYIVLELRHVEIVPHEIVMVEEKLVATAAELAECCARLAACERIGLDTEFVGEDTFHPNLCLIQIATPAANYLIDPFTVGPLDAFWEIATHPDREVVVHAGREEMRLFHLWCGRTPAKLFDLQIAAGLVGLGYPLSHGSLVDAVLDVQLRKGETLTEWRERPLTPEQLGYAFDDVRHLLPAWKKLHGRLQELNRLDWADEEFARLRLHGGAAQVGINERWRKIRGIGSLSRRQLAVVRELHAWRDDLAAQENRPSRALLRDDLIVEIARRNPKAERDLKIMRGLPRRVTPGIMQAVERARQVPTEECPAVSEREHELPQVALIVSLLGAVLADCGVRLQVASNLIATNQDLKRLVRTRLGEPAAAADSLLTQGWRGQHILPELEAVLDGRRALCIDNVRSTTPFRFVDFDSTEA